VIGVFDSGIGGLSVLRALKAELPLEDFVYVADAGHAPYGERDDAHLIARAQAITQYLLAQHRIKALVVACNTATAAAVHVLRAQHPQLPIVGVEPALKPAAALSKTKHVGVLATRATLGSAKFQALLQSLAGQAQFHCQPCDGLADALERGDTPKTTQLSRQYVQALGQFGAGAGQMDTLVLGCTHYPFAQAELQALAGPGVTLIESGAPVARQTRRVLAAAQALAEDLATAGTAAPHGSASPPRHTGRLLFLTTGQPAPLAAALQRWLGLLAEPVRHVEIDSQHTNPPAR
jgi:glutamate racemase